MVILKNNKIFKTLQLKIIEERSDCLFLIKFEKYFFNQIDIKKINKKIKPLEIIKQKKVYFLVYKGVKDFNFFDYLDFFIIFFYGQDLQDLRNLKVNMNLSDEDLLKLNRIIFYNFYFYDLKIKYIPFYYFIFFLKNYNLNITFFFIKLIYLLFVFLFKFFNLKFNNNTINLIKKKNNKS